MADDLIASARSMTVASDGQFNTIGLPKGGLTPATITAMAGMQLGWGNGLDVSPSVTAAIGKLQGRTSSLISGLPSGAASALGNVGISLATINASTDPAATVTGIKNALATDGIMLDTATETSLTESITAGNKLAQLNAKLMNGGPAIFMQKFNAAKAHINDAIELRKVTDFCSNTSFDKFGKGISNMASLATQGIDGTLGNMKSIGAAMKATGKLFDPANMGSFGKPEGFINQLTKNKMANASGLTAAFSKFGVPMSDLSNPAYQEKIKSAMGSIADPKIMNAVAEQMEVNPFAGLPSATGSSSITENSAGQLLGGATQAPQSTTPAEAAPPADTTVKEEAGTNPTVWAGNNDETLFGKANIKDSKQEKINALDQEISAVNDEVTKFLSEYVDAREAYANASYALEFSKAGVKAEWQAIAEEYKPKILTPYDSIFPKVKEFDNLRSKFPTDSPEWFKWNKIAAVRNSQIKLANDLYRGLVDVKKDILAKIAAAGGS